MLPQRKCAGMLGHAQGLGRLISVRHAIGHCTMSRSNQYDTGVG